VAVQLDLGQQVERLGEPRLRRHPRNLEPTCFGTVTAAVTVDTSRVDR
jgi:hypothetical protein